MPCLACVTYYDSAQSSVLAQETSDMLRLLKVCALHRRAAARWEQGKVVQHCRPIASAWRKWLCS